MTYDPDSAPDPERWLSLDETQRIDRVATYHRRAGVKLPNVRLHAMTHVIVENQIAEAFDLARDAMERLRVEGLTRHEAVHAIGSVFMEHVWNLMTGHAEQADPTESYFQALRGLTASGWQEKFGTERTVIPPGSKVPVTLTFRERDLIRNKTFCDPDFAKCAVVEGTGIRMDLSLDEIEEIQGYVAAASNHMKNSKLRKDLNRLFDKLQGVLDTYDDQSE